MRDLVHNIGAVQVVGPAVLSATNTSAAIDLAEFGSAALIINTGAIAGSGDFTAKLQDSDDGSTGWADVAAGDLIGTSRPASPRIASSRSATPATSATSAPSSPRTAGLRLPLARCW